MFCIAFVLSLISIISCTPCPEKPLFKLGDMEYVGGFRVPAGKQGSSDANYAQPAFSVYTKNNAKYMFMTGHDHQQAIAELKIPEIVNTSVVVEMKKASFVQDFYSLIGRVKDKKEINKILGLFMLPSQELLAQVYEYYDADTSVRDTSMVVKNPQSLSNTTVEGYYRFRGAFHAAGWVSPIPSEYQECLAGPFIAGSSSGVPIIGRTSVGPSAFSFDPANIKSPFNDSTADVPTTTLMDFSLKNQIIANGDLSNGKKNNSLWTHLSQATYGFIVPNTNTYFTMGKSGGHESGVCYKCTQDNGRLCGGYCTPKANDNYAYYWLFDIKDFVKVQNGEMKSWEVQPYDYGKFPKTFSRDIGGASFDPTTNLLYVAFAKADNDAGRYSNPPLFTVFKIAGEPTGQTPPTTTKAATTTKAGSTASATGSTTASVTTAAPTACLYCKCSPDCEAPLVCKRSEAFSVCVPPEKEVYANVTREQCETSSGKALGCACDDASECATPLLCSVHKLCEYRACAQGYVGCACGGSDTSQCFDGAVCVTGTCYPALETGAASSAGFLVVSSVLSMIALFFIAIN